MLLSYVYGVKEHALQPFWVNSGFGKERQARGKVIGCSFQDNALINHCALKISIQVLMSECTHEIQILRKSSNYLVIKNCA